MKKLEIHTSPLTGTIYAGVPLKDGTWGNNKHEVTMDALVAVAEHVLRFGQPVVIYKSNKVPEYKITVEKLS